MPGTLEDYAAAVNHVISICRDAEQGFRGAANAAKESELKDMLEQYSVLHGGFAAELQEAVKAMGFDSTSAAGAAGVLYAGWIQLKAALDGHDSHSILWRPSGVRIGASAATKKRWRSIYRLESDPCWKSNTSGFRQRMSS